MFEFFNLMVGQSNMLNSSEFLITEAKETIDDPTEVKIFLL